MAQLPSKAQCASGATGHKGDLHNTLMLLRNQAEEHVTQISDLTAKVAMLLKKVK